ncbi:hypothetical protein [Halobacillus karajensis]|nr:hypothetical protein [Halobacillus karajensis]
MLQSVSTSISEVVDRAGSSKKVLYVTMTILLNMAGVVYIIGVTFY